jgi:hypothetical protein
MATPTIIIGIGTSGLRTLEYVQRFHYESFGVNKPDHVQYLYIETNQDNEVGITPSENEIKRVYISLKELKTMCINVTEIGAKWVPPLEDLLNYGLGAGGVRPVGRVGFWGKNNDQKNYIKVKDSIREAHSKVRNINNKDVKDIEPVVFITGTLTGGTGSGIFIDLAYLVRNTIKNIKELYGLFLIPPIPEDLFENAQYYANTYGAIKDLNYFNDRNTHYKETLPDGDEVDFSEPPFDLTHLISQNHIKGDPAISTLEGLYKMAGLNLFLNIAGVKEHRTERLVDSPVSKFGTFGLSAIQYPKDQIQEYISTVLSIELLQRWNDPKQFISQGHKNNIARNEIADSVGNTWDEIIDEAFNVLDSLGGNKTIKNEIELLTRKLVNGDFTNPYDELYKQFTSRSANNFYVAVNDNLPSAANIIIDRIFEYNCRVLNETENLIYAKITLEYFSKFISDTLNYWKNLELSSMPANWEVTLEKLLKDSQKNNYKYIGEKYNVIADRLYAIYNILKMHHLIKKLVDIKDNLIDNKSPIVSSSQKPRKLPKAQFYTDLSKQISNLINDKNSMSFEKRQSEILRDINDNTLPILRIYQYSSFDKEVENALTEYRRNKSYPSKKDVIDNEDLWDYFTSNDKLHLQKLIYKDCITKYREHTKSQIKDFDVNKFIKANLSDSVRIAKKATNVFLSIKEGYTLDTAHYLPRFVASSSKSSIQEVLDLFKDKENFYDFDISNPKTILELPKLQNIMVFYDEKSSLIPLDMISYADQMKRVYETKPKTIKDITDDQWKIRTRAYVPES